MSQIYLSLDLETTGLSPETDEIIEVAAVKFDDHQVLDTFHSLVRPKGDIPFRIQMLTGISPRDVESAPPFPEVVGELASFVGAHPIVGQNVSFDRSFLAHNGLTLANPAYDTIDLASLLLPCVSERSLAALTAHLGIPFSIQHRALPDAIATKEVFLALLQQALKLDLPIVSEINRLLAATKWSLQVLLQDIQRIKSQEVLSRREAETISKRGLEDVSFISSTPRLEQKGLSPRLERVGLDVEALAKILDRDGPFAQTFPGFEARLEQGQMLQAVAQALNDSQHLIVEAGTGTGKSVAYLLPTILFALINQTPIVISTNTINLQEQLMDKDVPDLLRVLRSKPAQKWLERNKLCGGNSALDFGALRVAQLKGRSNYLCLKRWASLHRSDGLSTDEVKVLARVLVWLSSTLSGDRSEINLASAELMVWNRICAQLDNCLTGQCSYQKQGSCFLYRARRAAENAHLIIVNHALLLSDLLSANKVLPEFSYLIVDEAHHLEEQATEQLGYQVMQRELLGYFDRLSQEFGGGRYQGLLWEIIDHIGKSRLASSIRKDINQLVESTLAEVEETRKRVLRFFRVLSDFSERHAPPEAGEYERNLRLTRAVRQQPGWSVVEIAREELSTGLTKVESNLIKLQVALGDSLEDQAPDSDDLLLEISLLIHTASDLNSKVNNAISNPEAGTIYWISLGGQNNPLSLCAAPLHVGGVLEKRLFSKKDSVILTSATLSTEGNFEYIKKRLGFAQARELILGAPFDYMGSTMIYVPNDIPEPGLPGYQQAVEGTLMELGQRIQGQTMALFTSHAALRATCAAIRGPLEREQVIVLGHGIDGSPRQILATFKSNSRSFLLGTSSFWEGVDVVGQALSVLVITKLPFAVPSDPVFAARSETFDDPFNQYALPQSILRFKQGFGRLIRSKTDRGVVVVLDRRISTRSYGSAFFSSLPLCTTKEAPRHKLSSEVARWLGWTSNDSSQRLLHEK